MHKVFVSWCLSFANSSTEAVINRAHSFPQEILPNSAGQFAKFRGSPWQNGPNFATYRGLLFVHKLSCILFKKNFSF